MKTCSIALLISALLASPLTLAQVYKWTDENGQVHFSSTPPPQQAIEPVDVRLNYDAPAPAPRTETDTASSSSVSNDSSNGSDQPSATASSNSSRSDDCRKVMEYADYDVPNLKSILRKNHTDGYISRSQYDTQLRSLEQAGRSLSHSACMRSSGRERELYDCLAQGGGLAMCYDWQ